MRKNPNTTLTSSGLPHTSTALAEVDSNGQVVGSPDREQCAICLRPFTNGHGYVCADCWDRIPEVGDRRLVHIMPVVWSPASQHRWILTPEEWRRIGPDPTFTGHLIYASSNALEDMPVRIVTDIEVQMPRCATTFAIGRHLFPPVLPHRIVESYGRPAISFSVPDINGRIKSAVYANDACASFHRRIAWSAYVNHTNKSRTWYGCPTFAQLHWPSTKDDMYARARGSEFWLGRLRYWIKQGHTERDLNYNYRGRFQYRDWMFWSGTGLTHSFGSHHAPHSTYRRSFWLVQGLTDATGPDVRSEYWRDYQAQLLLRINESVRVSLHKISRPFGTSCSDGNAAVGTTLDIVPEHDGPSPIRALARAEVQQEIEQGHLKIEALRRDYELSPHTKFTANSEAKYEGILSEAGMGQNPPVGENDFGARAMLKMTRISEAERTTPEGQHRFNDGFAARNDDEQEELRDERHLNVGDDYIGDSNRTDEGAERGWDEQRQLPTDNGWAPKGLSKVTEEFASAIRIAVFGSPKVVIRTVENEQRVWSYPKFSEHAFQLKVLTQRLRKQKKGVKSNTVVKQFVRGEKHRSKLLELSQVGGPRRDPEFVEAYNNWLKQSPLPGGWYVVASLKKNQPRLYQLDCPIECEAWSPDYDNYIPREADEAFAVLWRSKRAEAERQARYNGDSKRAARKRINDALKRVKIFYLLPPDNRKP